MEAAAHAEAHARAPAASRNKSSRIDAQLLGILLFIISEAMLFGSFFTAYFFIRVVQDDAVGRRSPSSSRSRSRP